MRNEILRQLQSEYEQQRMLNGQEEDRRREEAIRRCDGLRDLIDERQQIIYRAFAEFLAAPLRRKICPNAWNC